MAVALAGLYANNLHLVPDRKSHQHLITQIFTGQMLILSPNNNIKALKVLRKISLKIYSICQQKCWSSFISK